MSNPIEGFFLDKKPVFDWNHVPVGTVMTAERDPKTRATKHFRLELTPDAAASLGVREASIELPISCIFGMRRDGVTLDRSLHELRKIDRPTSVLKK